MSFETPSYFENNQKPQINITEGMKNLKKDIENTTRFRSSLCSLFWVSEEQSKNNAFQNFRLGIIDGLMEFPAIVEMYINNEWFRDLLWEELKKISFSDLLNSLWEIGKSLSEGDPYEKWKWSTRALLLITGIGWILKQFGLMVVKNAWKITIKNVAIWTWTTTFHGIWYATENRWKKTFQERNHRLISKNLPF